MCNNCLATLAQAISVGVRNLALSSIVWTCDAAEMGETFSWGEEAGWDSSQVTENDAQLTFKAPC